jgi:hypothetical protein
VDQALGPQGDHPRVPNRVGLDSAHNKDRHPEDPDLEALSSSKDQREGLRRDHNSVREGVHRRDPSGVAQEDRVLSSPHKDLWVGRHLHREGLADHPPEARAHLNGQNKTSRSSWGARCLELLCASINEKNSIHETNLCKFSDIENPGYNFCPTRHVRLRILRNTAYS